MSTTATSLSRAPRPSSLADVLDLILDKGLVIDAYVRVSVAGIELLTIDARVVVASVDTYLRFAEAVNRLDLAPTEQQGIKALTGGDDDRSQENGQSQQDSRAHENGSRQRAGSGGGRNKANASDGDDANDDESDGDEQDENEDENQSDEEESESPGLIGRLAERARFDR